MQIKTIGTGGDYETAAAAWTGLLQAMMEGDGNTDDYTFRFKAGTHVWDVDSHQWSGGCGGFGITIEPDPATRATPPIISFTGSSAIPVSASNTSGIIFRNLKVHVVQSDAGFGIASSGNVLIENCIIAVSPGDGNGNIASVRMATIIRNCTYIVKRFGTGLKPFSITGAGSVLGRFHNNIIVVGGSIEPYEAPAESFGSGHKNNAIYDSDGSVLVPPAGWEGTVVGNPLFTGTITWTNTASMIASDVSLQSGSPVIGKSDIATSSADDIIGTIRTE